MAQATASAGPLLQNAPVSVVISTQDLARCLEFYTNKLGLRVTEQTDQGAFIHCGNDTTIYAYVRDEAPKATNTVASFIVNDVEATVKALSNNGVTFEEYDFPGLKTVHGIATNVDGWKAAWFKDPDGNTIGIGNR